MLARSANLAFALSTLLSLQVAAHGAVIQPWTRSAGEKSKEVCGQQWFNDRNGHDNANNKMGPIAEKDLAGNRLPDACNWRLCGGAQFEDNKEHVYTWEAGTEVPIEVFSLNRHGGVANVSVVDTATNTVIGSALKEWTDGKYLEFDFSNTCPSHPPLDEVSFNVTIPALGDKCTQAGSCVLQWYWYSEKANNQTFESCIDFVQPFGGSPVAAPVTDAPSTTSWYRYCSPHSTTIDYWNATASLPLAINTKFLDFAADVITAVVGGVSSVPNSAAVAISTSFVSASSSVTSTHMPSLLDGLMATPMASSGSSVGAASTVQQTDAAVASPSLSIGFGATVSTSTATIMPDPTALTSSASSSTGDAAELAEDRSSSDIDAETETSDVSSSVNALSSAAPVAGEMSSAVVSALPSDFSVTRSKTVCRARPSSFTSASVATATYALAPAVTSADAEEISESSSAASVESSLSSAQTEDGSANIADAAPSTTMMVCAEASTMTVTETSTVTATVYIELVPVGTSTGVTPVVSQTLGPVPTGRKRTAATGHGVHKRRHAGHWFS